jgi:hypothetical protein
MLADGGIVGLAPVLIPIPAWAFVACMLVGSVLLAAWTLLRFERLGPRSLTGGFIAVLAGMMLVTGLPAFIDGVLAAHIPAARLVIVFGLALPTFTYLFLASGWFMRSILGQLPGHFN